MPKVDYFLQPGEVIPKALEGVIKSKFKSKDLEKLARFGGRIQISVTAPFIDRKGQDKKLEITDEFIRNLKINFVQANDLLKNLTQKQLMDVAKKLEFSAGTQSNVNELRDSLIRFLQSEDRWKKISDSENLQV